MTLSTIMVHLDIESSGDTCLGTAVDLTEQFDAKLIGVAAAALPWSYLAQDLSPRLIKELNAGVTKSLAATEDRFRRATKGVRRVEWRSAIAEPTTYVLQQARASDLVVVRGNRDDLVPDPLLGHLDPGDFVMRAGRPVFIVPPNVGSTKLKSAMVAWKDTREARRAIHDALPLLHKVQDVIVAEIIDEESYRGSSHAQLDDVVSWLDGHGIAAVARVFHFPEHLDPMAKLWEYGTDFLVAGAYGHARLREWIFGGFTRDLLTRSPQCALLAH
jgi:nucleotide-binding universal stress UspA family protein